MQRTRLATASTTAAIAVAVTLLLSGCSIISNFIGPGDAVRDENGQVTESGDVDVYAIAVGDCFNDEPDADMEEIFSVPIVPCDEPHDNEVYYEFELPAGDYPGDAEIDELSSNGCYEQFAGFVGIDYDESVLDYLYFMPTEAAWDADERGVQCSVYDPSTKIAGTLANAAY